MQMRIEVALTKVNNRLSVMSAISIIERQVSQIRQGGRAVLFGKMKRVLWILLESPLFILAIPVVVVIRLIKPWLLVRWGDLRSSRIGHFAVNTELYLCERDAGINLPRRRHADLCFMARPICNQQLAKMWKRVLRVWPAWILSPICRVNRLIPGGAVYEIGNNTQHDRDVHNLLDRFPPHLKFTSEEEARGEAGLRAMGISPGTPFVSLTVRDSAYLDAHIPATDWSYHNYRDSDIQHYVLAAEELADRGYFVIRMGAKVHETITSGHPRVIDYAANGMRSDFMDIYIAAKCDFCISGGSGFTAVPLIFRRPIVYVNVASLGYLCTFSAQFIGITKNHFAVQMGRELTLREIFTHGVGFCTRTSDYESKDVRLIENTREEIRDLVIEMVERLNGTWQPQDHDEALQRRFWEIFPADAVDARQGRPLQGKIRARFGTVFLRNNSWWLE